MEINAKWSYELHLNLTGDVIHYHAFGMLMIAFGNCLTDDEEVELEHNAITQIELLNFECGAIDEFTFDDTITLKRIRG